LSINVNQIGNGSGYLYITRADGVNILFSLINNKQGRRTAIQHVNASYSLTSATDIYDPTYGLRVFGNTTGSEGSLTGATEITEFLIPRSSNAGAFKTSVTISGGVVTTTRVSNNMTLVVATEGGLADTLNTLTITNVVDNDQVTIVGVSAGAGDIVTIDDSAGNIYLSNGANFITGARSVQIVLKYFSSGTAGWYEVSRSATQPTVANQRAVGVPAPVSGVNATALTAGGGTINIEAGVDKGTQVYTGSATLLGSWVIQPTAVPTTPYLDGDEIWIIYNATLTPGANTVTIFGIQLTTQQALAGNVVIRAIYKLSNTTWYADLFSSSSITITFADAAARAASVPAFHGQVGTQLDTNILYLANGTTAGAWQVADCLPASTGNNYVLQKDIAGNYAFVPPVSTGYQVFANSAARALAIPSFIGELGTQLDTDTTYVANGTSAGNWQLPTNTQIQSDTYAVATGTNTYAITLTPALLTYAAGNSFKVLFTNSNTTPATLNVNSLGARSLRKFGGEALSQGDIKANTIYTVTDDGTNYQISGGVPSVSQSSVLNLAAVSGASALMLGFAGSITPMKSGYVMVHISGEYVSSDATGATTFSIRIGTGSAPANGAAATGTVQQTLPLIASSTTARIPFSFNKLLVALTFGTTYWIDVSAVNAAAGSVQTFNVSLMAVEL